MIDLNNPTFKIDYDPDRRRGEFVRPLPQVIEAHMRTSQKYFTPGSIKEDFEKHQVYVTRQALHSALKSLAKDKHIVKDGRAQYRHRNTL